MIKSKKDLQYYLLQDEIARFGEKVSYIKKIKTGLPWKYNRILRRLEYTINCKKSVFGTIEKYWLTWQLRSVGMKLGWSIAPNCFGPGLCVVHYGTVIVNNNAHIGANCRIQAGVNIGANGGSAAPCLGDNIYIGPGAKIFGDIYLASNIAVGANAVVNKSCYEESVTLAGVPAKVVSSKGSACFINNTLRDNLNTNTKLSHNSQ